MSCCFGNDTDGNEPQKSISDPSDPPSNRPIIPVNKPANSEIEYIVTVKTGDFRNSGTNGPVYINIFSRDDKQTNDILLSASDKPFLQGSIRKFQVNAIDIGKPQRVIIRHEDKSTGWYVDYVEVVVHNFLVRFVANRWLNHLKNDRKLEVELFGSEQPAVIYEIEVQTGVQQIETLDSPVYMQLYGTTTNTPKLFLEAKNVLFRKDSISKFHVSSNNVGEIERIIIGHEGLGTIQDWHLKHVKVQMLSQRQEYEVDKWLSPTQGEQILFVELSNTKPQSPSPPPLPSPPPKYLIAIETGDVTEMIATDSIEIIVRGSDGQISKISLKEHAKVKDGELYQKGNVDEFEIEHPDIGTIESITIGFSDSRKTVAWLLEHISIQYKEIIYHFQAHCWLSSRLGSNFSWITIKSDESNDDINYKVIIVTGESGISANVILCIFGDKDTTTNLPLKTTKDGSIARFEKDSTLEFDINAVDVGKIKKINIGHDGKDSDHEWFLKSIQVEKIDEQYTFQANRWLSTEKDDKKTFIDLIPDEPKPPTPLSNKDQSTYLITIVTSSRKDAGTDSNVFMTIFGDKDITKQFQLTNTKQGDKALFKSGETNEFEMELDDVGIINKINIGHDGQSHDSQWYLESIQIQKGSNKYNFVVKQLLDQTTSFIDVTPILPNTTSSSESIQMKSSRSITPIKETSYKVSIQTGSTQKDMIKDNVNLYIVIYGENNQTEKLYLTSGLISTKTFTIKKDEKNDFQFNTADVGKITKLVIGQNNSENPIIWYIDHVIINETITFNAEQTLNSSSEIELYPSSIPKKTEIIYKILLQTGAYHQEGSDSNIYLTIVGKNGQTKKLPLNKTTRKSRKNSFKTDERIEFELKAKDVGKISKIILSQNPNQHGIHWHIDRLTIMHNNETTIFHIQRKNEKMMEIELIPVSQSKQSESPRKIMKTLDSISKVAVKRKDADYTIIITTGEQAIEVPVSMKIRGDYGTVSIPLSPTKGGEKAFQSKATNEFSCQTTDVGKIQQITVEHNEKDKDILWHLKTVQIKKGNETYNFNADVRLDRNDNKVNLYPVGALSGHQRDDYVQSELRRLRENLRCESSKLHRPPQLIFLFFKLFLMKFNIFLSI
ncbi:hypothetical protein I4U23_028622 [Adineta vaga]|nr:hypothetical protein I4U23_028622 [Adineta vaga]